METKLQEEVWRRVQAINEAWRKGRGDILKRLLHSSAVFVMPGFSARLVGREACIGSYQDFGSRAKVKEFQELDPHVQVAGDSAVATYRFDIVYTIEGKTYRSTGAEIFVFAREAGEWSAHWRTMIPETEEELSSAPN